MNVTFLFLFSEPSLFVCVSPQLKHFQKYGGYLTVIDVKIYFQSLTYSIVKLGSFSCIWVSPVAKMTLSHFHLPKFHSLEKSALYVNILSEGDNCVTFSYNKV